MLNQLFVGAPIGADVALTLISLPIAWAISSTIRKRYTDAVKRHQQESADVSTLWDRDVKTDFIAAAPSRPPSATVQSLVGLAQRKKNYVLLAYAIAGGVHALTAALWQLLVYQSTVSLFKVLCLSVIFSWPLLLTAWLITSTCRKRMIHASLGYGVGLIFASLLAGVPFWGFLYLWLGLMATPSIILWILSHRKLQTIGHFVFPIVLFCALALNFSLSFWGLSESLNSNNLEIQ
jgi:hypothetical protein